MKSLTNYSLVRRARRSMTSSVRWHSSNLNLSTWLVRLMMKASCQCASLLTMTSIKRLSDIEPLRKTDSLQSLFPVNPLSRLCLTQVTFTLRTVVRRTKAIVTTLAATLVMPALALRMLLLLTWIFLTWWAIPAIRLSNLSPNNLRCKWTLCKWWWCSSRQQIRWWLSNLWTQWWLRCSKLWPSEYRCSNKWCSSNSLSSNLSNLLLRSPILMMLLDVLTKSWQTWIITLNQLPHRSHLTSMPQECILVWAQVNTIPCRWEEVLILLPQLWQAAIRTLTTTGQITRLALTIITHSVRVPLLSLGSVMCMSSALTWSLTCRINHATTMCKNSKISLLQVCRKSRHHQRLRLV